MSMQHPELIEITRRDPRYPYEAYEFLFEALHHTQQLQGRLLPLGKREPGAEHHVSGQELVLGCCDLAKQEFGLMAKIVFHQWGIRRTDDIGEMVFNLIEAQLMSKTENDRRSDFENIFDIDRVLNDGHSIPLDEVAWIKRGTR
jgi:uncharacterized repeat protein (TIGR04138 family)